MQCFLLLYLILMEKFQIIKKLENLYQSHIILNIYRFIISKFRLLQLSLLYHYYYYYYFANYKKYKKMLIQITIKVKKVI